MNEKGRQAGGGRQAGDAWAEAPAFGPRRADLLSLIPLLAIVALVALVAAVVWAVRRGETEQAAIKLATDALWVEQQLRFQLGVHEDLLVRLALDAEAGTARAILDNRARMQIANNPELLSVVWYGADGNRIRALPSAAAHRDDALAGLLMQRASRSARPIFGDVQADGVVTIGLPLAGDHSMVTASVSLPLLLERHVPWWIAEQYAVRIQDSAGADVATRHRMAPDPGHPSHAISFDPPLRGMVLRISAYDPPPGLNAALPLAVIAALAIFAILSLLVLFRSAQRRRAAEARWRGETAFRRSMEESLTVGLRAKDHDGHILYVNSAFCQLVGFAPEELVGRAAPLPYWDPDSLEETLDRQARLGQGGIGPQSFATRFRHRDGHPIEVQVYEAPLVDAQGVHRGWMGSVIDMTEQNRAARLARAQDEALAHTGRLVSLGEMASTLAHELNQPLAAIASYAAGMANLIAQGDGGSPMLAEANRKLAVQAERAGQIIRHIRDLVRKREPHFAETDLAGVIAETVGFLTADARAHGLRIETRIAPVPPVAADRILLEQVLINLLRNGMEAMADTRGGDRLTITLAPVEGQAVIEVADQGAGLPPEMAGRLFEPFASTKDEGMGMGLTICRSIVELHRGQLSHRPAPGGGAIFRIALPLAGADRDGQPWAA